MKFLEASRRVQSADPSKQINLLVASSAQLDNIEIYIKAEYVERDTNCHITYLPFNTLPQYLLTPASTPGLQVVFIFPWDYLAELDWRSGIPGTEPDLGDCIERITQFELLLSKKKCLCVYIDAPIPPIFNSLEKQASLLCKLKQSAIELCALTYDANTFNLGSYLDSGIALTGNACGSIAFDIVKELNSEIHSACKLLITDLDNVVWRGVIGEDGYEGIHYLPAGQGYIHFIYQTYLKKLKQSGILLAAVSKNDPDLAKLPFVNNEMVLKEDDFVTIQASYQSKSSQIRQISEKLNLNVADFVFIDDNRLEIKEVQQAIPEIQTILFPESNQIFNEFCIELSKNFNILQLTTEDRNRTSLYKSRLASLPSSNVRGSDLTQFLQTLNMKISINNRSEKENERALQLFNKTNQFNINGIRLDRDELNQKLHSGYTLYTASNSDRYGDHGEILACLLDVDKNIEMLVMSCRVFQRRIEHYFLSWLSTQLMSERNLALKLRYVETERNTPVRHFFESNDIDYSEGIVSINMANFLLKNSELDGLFELQQIER